MATKKTIVISVEINSFKMNNDQNMYKFRYSVQLLYYTIKRNQKTRMTFDNQKICYMNWMCCRGEQTKWCDQQFGRSMPVICLIHFR